jgi:DNA replication protein DnaC
MLTNQTIDKLSHLRLPAMAESFKRILDNADMRTLPFEDVLGMIVDAEWTARQNKRLRKLLKLSGMPQNACIEDIDYRQERRLDRQVIAGLSECNWISQHRNLIITGSTGTGKSYLTCAIGNMACRIGYSVKYYRLPRLLTDLGIARMDGSYNRILSQLKKCNLLVMDDWGLAEITAADSRDILEVIEERTNTGSTILSAQIPVNEWYQLFADPTLADACLDRLVHNSIKIELKGPSMREVMARLTEKDDPEN